MNLKNYLIPLISIFLLASCSTSEDVVSKGFLQKRKYNKGFHKSFRKNTKTNKLESKEELALVENHTNSTSVSKEESRNTNVVTTNNHVSTTDKNISNAEYTPVKKATTKRINKIANRVAEKIENTISKESSVTKVKKENKKSDNSDTKDDTDILLLYVLAIFIPPLAVYLVTDGDTNTVILNIILCLLCGIPGIIHAFIVIGDNR